MPSMAGSKGGIQARSLLDNLQKINLNKTVKSIMIQLQKVKKEKRKN